MMGGISAYFVCQQVSVERQLRVFLPSSQKISRFLRKGDWEMYA